MFFTFPVFSQVVKTPFPVTNLAWSKNDEFFAFTEENTVFLRSCSNYELSDTLGIKNIDKIMFSTEGKHQILLAITKDGYFSVWNIESTEDGFLKFNKEPYFKLDCKNESEIKAVTFSKNSDYVAVASDDNSIKLFFKLRFTKDAIFKELKGHDSEIYSLNFSKNENFLASTAKDGTAIIWNCNSLSEILKLSEIYTQTEIPVQFLADNSSIIAPENETSFCIYNLEGEKLLSIDTLHKIKGIKPLNKENKIAIVTENDEIELYDLSKEKWLGYIPSYDFSPLTDFEFNPDNSRILIGYESGSIFEFFVKDVLLSPGQKPPKKITSAENYGELNSKGGTGSSSRGWGITNGTFKTRHGKYLCISANLRSAPSPYNLSAGFSTEFLTYDLLPPFYTGIYVSPYIGFPESNYPYKYTKNSTSLETPLLAGLDLCAPFGIFVMPFVNNEIGFSAEIFAGTGVCLLWNRNFGAESAASKPFISFNFGTKLGINWKYFSLNVAAQWDSVQKIMISTELGANFKIGEKK
ncbi:WD40 repeat domain-containing protein [Treponema berlinense]|uniref:WD40 domain-containing protein n=1 Tax=Treponema berlinense TaxID=225004 RepID=UPI002357C027|nr:WD40 repeat domain-containing protein [Treponema berlinense]